MKGSCNVLVSLGVSHGRPFRGVWRMKYVGSDGLPSVTLPPEYFPVDPLRLQLLRYHRFLLLLVNPML